MPVPFIENVGSLVMMFQVNPCIRFSVSKEPLPRLWKNRKNVFAAKWVVGVSRNETNRTSKVLKKNQ